VAALANGTSAKGQAAGEAEKDVIEAGGRGFAGEAGFFRRSRQKDFFSLFPLY
jgi:hypothetical protein